MRAPLIVSALNMPNKGAISREVFFVQEGFPSMLNIAAISETGLPKLDEMVGNTLIASNIELSGDGSMAWEPLGHRALRSDNWMNVGGHVAGNPCFKRTKHDL